MKLEHRLVFIVWGGEIGFHLHMGDSLVLWGTFCVPVSDEQCVWVPTVTNKLMEGCFASYQDPSTLCENPFGDDRQSPQATVV
jgi:hypothetical protein